MHDSRPTWLTQKVAISDMPGELLHPSEHVATVPCGNTSSLGPLTMDIAGVGHLLVLEGQADGVGG